MIQPFVPRHQLTAKVLLSMMEMTDDREFRKGVGVPDEVLQIHIEPFFTGVKYGLDLARGLVIEMGEKALLTPSEAQAAIDRLAEDDDE